MVCPHRFMKSENTIWDKKSLRLLQTGKPDLIELAKHCVAFANNRGGKIILGIEDEDSEPSSDQMVKDSEIEILNKRIPQLTVNVGIIAQRKTSGNGGEFIEVTIHPNMQSIASTSDARYYMRISDESRPLFPDELERLMSDKTAYVWETQTTKRVSRERIDPYKLERFLKGIRESDRVSPFVKSKSDHEIINYYLFATGNFLTNLGILWIGIREDRASLRYSPVIQFIKYDERDQKVNKLVWDDYSLNPMELIEAVWTGIPDWREGYEIPNGLFRKNVPLYDEIVVRELLANALVHRPYTQRGDIFLNLFSDRLEIHNPGLLPIGVSPHNILHTSVKRNIHLAKVFYDLRLMESEGSGFDKIYEVLVTSGKSVPEVREQHDRVIVTIRKQIINPAVIDFIVKADQTYHLTQKEKITLGILAQNESLTAGQLANILELSESVELRNWIGRLMKWKIFKSRGRTKATEYFVDPELLRKLDFKGGTTLRGIEAHRLRELIMRDLQIYKKASISQLHSRIGIEIPRRKIQHQLKLLFDAGDIGRQGKLKHTVYLWTKES